MKHCFITPSKWINESEIGGKSDFLLVLSHLIDSKGENRYTAEVKKFKKSKKEIILDNGLFENHIPESIESLLEKACIIEADVVFAPDYLYDNKKTQEAFEKFADARDELGIDIKLAYVVQATNVNEYIEGYKWAENNKRIDLIGISILSVPKSFEELSGSKEITKNRIICLKLLEDIIKPKKDAHLLGLGSSLEDLIKAKEYKWCVSNDSSSAFQNGLYGKIYLKGEVYPGGKVKKKLDFDLEDLQGREELIKKNILDFKQFVK